jgi:hypothetical protein
MHTLFTNDKLLAMTGFNLFTAPAPVTDKLNNLYNLLKKERDQYEQLAAAISAKELKRTVLTLAQQHNQYSNELAAHVRSLGCTVHDNCHEVHHAPEISVDDFSIISFCKMNEQKLVSAYREILNEVFLYEGLGKILRYQLNGILCSFTQLKLLHSLKFTDDEKNTNRIGEAIML